MTTLRRFAMALAVSVMERSFFVAGWQRAQTHVRFGPDPGHAQEGDKSW